MKLIPFENRAWLVACLAAGLAVPATAGDKTGTISAGKLARDAKKFYNQTVTVKAEVEDIIDSHTITLDEDAVLAGPDVLVLLPGAGLSGLRKDDVVLVTGVVRPFVVKELETDYDFFKGGKLLSREPKVEYEARPVLVATSVRTADGRNLFGTVAQTSAGADHSHHTMTRPVTTTGTTVEPAALISAGKLAKDAKKFYGRNVTVRAEVEDIFDTHTITLDEDTVFAGPDVLVLLPQGIAASLRKDDKITVSGTVRPFVQAELERDFDFFKGGKLVQSERRVEFETRPVLVATSVRTADGRELISMPLARVSQMLTTADLVRDLATFGTRTIIVRAPVSALLDTYSFVLDENTSLAGPDAVVVIPGGIAAGLRAGDVITISGTVRPWVVADMQRDFTFLSSGPVMRLENLDGRPVLVATSIRTANGTEIVLTPR